MKIGSKLWENIKIILRVEYFESLGCLKRVWKNIFGFSKSLIALLVNAGAI